MTRDQIIANNPLAQFLSDCGYELRPAGANFVTSACPARRHKDYHRPVTIDTEKKVWHCNDCKIGGSVIDWVMAERNISAAEAMHILGGGRNGEVMVATYDYTDANGKLLYQVCRFEPKDFRQRRPDGHGGWIWNTQGVQRVLYNLPTVLGAQCVVVVEGEKDCDRLTALGFTATTNVCGAGKWRDDYSETLGGKDVIVVRDNDEPGQKHVAQVIASLTGKARSIKLLILPDHFHDVSDYIASLSPKAAGPAIAKLIADTPLWNCVDVDHDEPPPYQPPPRVSREDFHAYMPQHNYIFIPTRDLWPVSSVDARLPALLLPDGRTLKASKWLDRNRPVEQMTWAPGLPMLVENRLISEGGWIHRNGCKTFNLYRPPDIQLGRENRTGERGENSRCGTPVPYS